MPYDLCYKILFSYNLTVCTVGYIQHMLRTFYNKRTEKDTNAARSGKNIEEGLL
jgi:hypothetical protein